MAKKVTAEPPGRASPAVHLNLPREPGASFPGGAGFFMPHDGLARSLEGARCCARRRHAVLALLADGDTLIEISRIVLGIEFGCARIRYSLLLTQRTRGRGKN